MNEAITIIENTREARNKHGYAWGGTDFILTAEHVQALLDGKCVAVYDGEYVSFFSTTEHSSV